LGDKKTLKDKATNCVSQTSAVVGFSGYNAAFLGLLIKLAKPNDTLAKPNDTLNDSALAINFTRYQF